MIWVVGEPRRHRFQQPLHPGLNLLAVPSLFSESPASLGLVTGDRFRGHADPAQADQIQFWLGDGEGGERGYAGYFRLEATGTAEPYWTGIEDGELRNENETRLFLRGWAFFFHAAGEQVRMHAWPAVE